MLGDGVGWLADLWAAMGDAAAAVVEGALAGFLIAGVLCGGAFLAHWLVTRGR